jgi:hypothetical protein
LLLSLGVISVADQISGFFGSEKLENTNSAKLVDL